MAKYLPFFKFDADDYLTGKIQLCDMETQGIFTNLCAMIWRENGALIKDRFLHKKLNVTSSTLERCLSDLKELEIVSENNEVLSVKFISSQLEQRSEFLTKCSKGGRESAKQRKGTSRKQKAESRKQIEDNKENIIKENFSDSDFPITATLEKLHIPDDIKELFGTWVNVRVACHGRLPAQSQDGQLKRLLDIPENLRKLSLQAAIDGTWKNIGRLDEQDLRDNQEPDKNLLITDEDSE